MNLLHANDRPGSYPASWYAATAVDAPRRVALRGEVCVDVCVVGGGYTGLSSAWHLARQGLRVMVLEAHRVGWGASGRNGGQVGSGQRLDQDWIAARLGRDDARHLWQIAESAKALVCDLARDMPGADWRPGVAHAFQHMSEVEAARRYAAHLAEDYGYDQIAPLDRAETAGLLGTDVYAGGELDGGAAHIHPLNFALGLARAAEAAGAVIHEDSEVLALEPGRPARLRTAAGEVRADHVILACNGYLGGLDPKVAARVMPINNFIVATEPLGSRAPLSRPVAVADSRFVVNYWRQTPDGRLLFGGGESYGWRFPDIPATVRKPMLQVYPQLADARIDHAWGGTLAITPTRNPCFIRPQPNVLSASGYSGHGVALATMAGQIMAEAIAGQTARFDVMARLPTPRFPGGTLLRHPVLVLAMTWFALRDRLGI
ncbi:gamma-glutamylputrescine oxidase [Gemmobacter megaterium]|uniref:Gamma-glutamylputrescine oxidase n=1 Tax=Gemmobacter megaterium TaxID=1086013 RepID=A0A1N7LSQ2_9RHOB|nr:FAD-binding oxidoreductase [Gemmobacter megaterium]GGE10761.1 gamma-glutamylputrescine oxidase [Gemmobacter megaterium]SIS76870.1 gamma-glutamylputrescine oxidase [Gemmobacter megaterium]